MKSGTSILSKDVFDKKSLTSTPEGKCLVSTYAVANAETLDVRADITVDIDSEFIMKNCVCTDNKLMCTCPKYSTPVRCIFASTTPKPKIVHLNDIRQRKGEAEMSQADWLLQCLPELGTDSCVASIVSSADIDAVVIHLFMLSQLWPRDPASHSFLNRVLVLLQKPYQKWDVYNITGILEFVEKRCNDVNIGVKLAMGLCMGGNDFLPKYYGISHEKVLLK